MSLEQRINSYVEAKEKSNVKKESFLKQILLMSSGLVGILVSLHDGNLSCLLEKIFFSSTLLLISLGILLLSIALFEQVDSHNKLAQDYWVELRKQLEEKPFSTLVLAYPKRIYIICERIGYISLVLSIFSLTIYGILIS